MSLLPSDSDKIDKILPARWIEILDKATESRKSSSAGHQYIVIDSSDQTISIQKKAASTQRELTLNEISSLVLGSLSRNNFQKEESKKIVKALGLLANHRVAQLGSATFSLFWTKEGTKKYNDDKKQIQDEILQIKSISNIILKTAGISDSPSPKPLEEESKMEKASLKKPIDIKTSKSHKPEVGIEEKPPEKFKEFSEFAVFAKKALQKVKDEDVNTGIHKDDKKGIHTKQIQKNILDQMEIDISRVDKEGVIDQLKKDHMRSGFTINLEDDSFYYQEASLILPQPPQKMDEHAIKIYDEQIEDLKKARVDDLVKNLQHLLKPSDRQEWFKVIQACCTQTMGNWCMGKAQQPLFPEAVKNEFNFKVQPFQINLKIERDEKNNIKTLHINVQGTMGILDMNAKTKIPKVEDPFMLIKSELNFEVTLDLEGNPVIDIDKLNFQNSVQE